MPFQFYKSKTLLNSGSLPSSFAYVKSDVTNINDGGELLRVQSSDYGLKNITYASGSITSVNAVSQQISQFVSAISSSEGPYVEIPEAEFVDFYSSSVAFFDNLG